MSGPFPGLRPFDEQDPERLFARDEWTEIIIANLVASRLTVLYGESGVGKTSLLQAGVEADLRRGRRGARSRFSVVPVVFRDWKRDPVAGLIGRLRHMDPDGGNREARGGADLGAALREGAAGMCLASACATAPEPFTRGRIHVRHAGLPVKGLSGGPRRAARTTR